MIRRGTPKVETVLRRQLDYITNGGHATDEDEPPRKTNEGVDVPTKDFHSGWWHTGNVELLTALRRIQKKADPLKIVVSLPDDLTANITPLPIFDVALVSADVERTPLWIIQGGDYRSGRESRWRFEVKDAEGITLALPPLSTEFFEVRFDQTGLSEAD